MGDHAHTLATGLSDQQPIEGILMVSDQIEHRLSMAWRDVQPAESLRADICDDLAGGER